MKEWLYILRPLREAMLTEGPTEDELRVLGEHVAHLTRLRDEGTLVLAGRTQYDDMRTIGLVVLRAPPLAACTVMTRISSRRTSTSRLISGEARTSSARKASRPPPALAPPCRAWSSAAFSKASSTSSASLPRRAAKAFLPPSRPSTFV